MFNVEYYVGAYKVGPIILFCCYYEISLWKVQYILNLHDSQDGDTWRTNKYIDAATMPPCEESNIQIWDRRPLYCIPVSVPVL